MKSFGRTNGASATALVAGGLRAERSGVPSEIGRAGKTLPLIVSLFVVSLAVPSYFMVGTLRLTPYLILLLLSFPPLVLTWLSGRAGRILLPDVLILGSALWSALTLLIHHGIAGGIEPSGIIIVQTFGAYLLGRCLMRGPGAMQRMIGFFLAAVLFMLPFGIYEMLTGVPAYLNFFGSFGPTQNPVDPDPRFGLDRVQGGFEHPILYGIFVSSGLGLVIAATRGSGRLLAVGSVTISTFLSLSTGALLCYTVQAGLFTWDWIFRTVRRRWNILGALAVGSYIAIDLISNRTPFHVFVSYMTLNVRTAYGRIHIWNHGSAEVARHPILGIGLGEWERPAWMLQSVDMFWLLIAMRHGLPAVLMLAGGFLILMFRAGRRTGLDEETILLRRGLIIALTGLFTAIWSVHLWNATYCWMMFLVGCLAWITEAGEAARSHAAGSAAQPAGEESRPPAKRTLL